MGKETGISWTDHTFNPWWGCVEVSPGCDNCYARIWAARFGVKWGKDTERRAFGDKHWNEPLVWDRQAAKEGRTHRVFSASMADILDENAPAGARERLWALIDATPNLIWQLLTKRPARYASLLPKEFKYSNVWLGTTTEDKSRYDMRKDVTRLAARDRGLTWWISYEPAIGPLRLSCTFCDNGWMHGPDVCEIPDWVVFGGESGATRRECDRKWADDVFADCRKYGAAFFMKQMSGLTPNIGKINIPSELWVQEWPGVL